MIFASFKLSESTDSETFHMQAAQLKEDWTAPLISDISVGEKCDDGFEVLFEHLWPGISRSCDCISDADIQNSKSSLTLFGDAVFKDSVDYITTLIFSN